MSKVVWRNQEVLNNEQLLAARDAKIAELKQACTEAIFKGFDSKSTGFSFGFNELDQQNFTQQALLIIGANGEYTDPIHWKTKTGSVEMLTAEQFKGLMAEAKTHKETEQHKYWVLEIQVHAAQSIEEIQSITW